MESASILAGVGGGAFELLGGWYNQRTASERQHEAQNFSAQQYATRYQTTVADLQAAGLNPMLAYMNGPGSSPTSSAASAQGVSGSQVMNQYNQHRLASAQEALMAAEKEKMLQDTKLSAATERNTDADTLVKAGMPAQIAATIVNLTASAEMAKAGTEKIRAEIPKVEMEVNNLRTLVEKNKSDIALNKSLVQANEYLNALRTAETYLSNQHARNAGLEGDILGPKAKAARTNTAELGHIADNIGKIGSAAWKFMFPSLVGTPQ